jgi:RND superfamily putative drug exporter
VPLFSIHVAMAKATTLATSGTARDGLDALTAGGVPTGTLTPISVLVRGTDTSQTARALAALPGVHDVIGGASAGFQAAGTSLLYVLPTPEATQPAGQDVVQAVRHSVAGDPGVLGVGGIGAQMHDFDHAIYSHFWLMLLLVAVVTFAVLAVALRSILLPVKAVLVNFASVAAAFGIMVLIWQDGHGSNAIWGVQATGTITFWVPVFVFAFVFGLSMDYEVFILSRIREEYDASGNTHEAVVTGLARTGRLISCAALILVFAFLAMSTSSQTAIKVLATGMGAGILLDATVVRCLLVPALVALFGRANWWWPARKYAARPIPHVGAGTQHGPDAPGNRPDHLARRA